jgi:hypothetical protein
MIDADSNLGPAADVIEPEMARILATKSEAERLKIAWGMWRSARTMISRIVAAEHPELSAEERQVIVARRLSHGA